MLSFIFKLLLFHLSGKNQNKIVLLLSEIISLFFTLYVFSISNNLVDSNIVSGEALNFFHFLLIGELALILPVSFFENIIRNYLEFHNSLFIETLKGSQISYYSLLFKKSFSELFFPMIRICLMLVISVLAFNFYFSFVSIFLFVIVQAMSLFAMSFLAGITIQVYENYRRGLKAVYMLNSILAIIGGSYFPVKFLPEILSKYVIWLFPQSFILQLSRLSFNNDYPRTTTTMCFFVFYLMLFGYLTKTVINYLKKRHQMKLFDHVSFANLSNSK